MRYRILLNLFLLICLSAPLADAAAQSRYRVEIIVLTHLEHDEQPRVVQALEDFSSATDFLASPAEAAERGDGAESGNGVPLVAGAVQWNALVHLPELGPQMQDAWRRLRLSEPFRPLQYLAWEQGGSAPFPTLRLHDLEVLQTQAAGVEAPTAQVRNPDDGADEPPPVLYYRLDGAASLTRSRFLHLAVAVELREPGGGALDPSLDPAATSFLVHRLEQSRVIRTGRMEYFDGPVLGVLAWVTDVSEAVTEEPPE